MLTHTRDSSWRPTRTVVLGSAGFVGGAIVEKLKSDGQPVLGVTRSDVDLLSDTAASRLAAMLQPTDAVVVISARAPCKNNAMLEENIRMMRSVCEALTARPVDHVVYVSSDAVYADSSQPLTENSCAEPGSLHGVMHLARELMLGSVIGDTPYAILRPTLIYGARDPHNGYGPNQFRRKAARGEDIVLFGEGEEQRDHILVSDVAEIAICTLMQRSHGVLNAATGTVTSFREIADRISAMFASKPKVLGSPRKGPMPHNGYRAFDISDAKNAFPHIAMTSIEDGLKLVHQQTKTS